MPTLHMDVEQARSAQASFANGSDAFDQMLSNVVSAVAQLENGAWTGNSATEFFQAFSDIRTTLVSKVEEMRNLASRLAAEIAEWENMAAKLG